MYFNIIIKQRNRMSEDLYIPEENKQPKKYRKIALR